MNIVIGWWIIPAIITLIGFIKLNKPIKGYGDIIDGLISGPLIIISVLISWLIYFIIF